MADFERKADVKATGKGRERNSTGRRTGARPGGNRSPWSVGSVQRGKADALVAVLGRKLAETTGHLLRVSAYSVRLGMALKFSEAELEELQLGGLLHDVGKIEIPSEILCKPGALTEEEWVEMRRHPARGESLLRQLNFSEGVAKIAGQHHERFDGTGYPNKLRGEQIQATTRVFTIADAVDAITSNRIYRAGQGFDAVLTELKKHAGTQFDPYMVRMFETVPVNDWGLLRAGFAEEPAGLRIAS